MQRRSRTRAVIALAVVVALVGAGWVLALDVVAAGRAHDRGLSRWEAAEPASYSFVYAECGGMCMECPDLITVRDGVVTDVVGKGDGGCGRTNPRHAPTMEDIFVIADEQRPGVLPERITTTITYDEEWGFPTSIDIDCPEGYLDCGGGWWVTDFEFIG